jgi:hypothetical protein
LTARDKLPKVRVPVNLSSTERGASLRAPWISASRPLGILCAVGSILRISEIGQLKAVFRLSFSSFNRKQFSNPGQTPPNSKPLFSGMSLTLWSFLKLCFAYCSASCGKSATNRDMEYSAAHSVARPYFRGRMMQKDDSCRPSMAARRMPMNAGIHSHSPGP